MVPLDVITTKVQLIQALYDMLGNEIAGLTTALRAETPAPTKGAADRNIRQPRGRGRHPARKRKSVAAPVGIGLRQLAAVPDANEEYTVKEVSGFLGRSRGMVLKYIKEGILTPEAEKEGRNYVIRGAEVLKFMSSMEANKHKGNGLSTAAPPVQTSVGV